MTRIIALAASLAAVAALAVGASAASAADRPTLADAVAARLGVSTERLREAFRGRSPRASTRRSPQDG